MKVHLPDDPKELVKFLFRILVAVALIVYAITILASNDKGSDSVILTVISILFIACAVGFIVYTVFSFVRLIFKNSGEEEMATKADSKEKIETAVGGNEYNSLKRLFEIYNEYSDATQQLMLNKKSTDGLFGLGNDPKKDACHDDFYTKVATEVRSLSEKRLQPTEACEAIQFMVRTPVLRKNSKLSYPMMYAALGLIDDLIQFLDKDMARQIAEDFDSFYPKEQRLPVQEKDFEKLLLKSKE